jgi:hypothetical protein
MTPAAEYIFNFSLWIPDCYRAPYTKYGPGQFVLSRSQETRELLKTLKSEDLRNIRDDLVFVPIR